MKQPRTLSKLSSAQAARIPEALCNWFESEARDLPWRANRTGYTALVAEAMLQQTQVSRVIDRFNGFLQQFPTIQSLAAADEQQVLASWRGLGYYRRAKNLHAAAKAIVEHFNSKVPADVDNLLTLPGVGRYTAGAIASMVYNQPAAAVDGNIMRVLSRLFVDSIDSGCRTHSTSCWNAATQLVTTARHPGRVNEALMELGAMVCLPAPAKPQCDRCPLARECQARARNIQTQVPKPRSRPLRSTTHHHAIVVLRRRDHAVLLQQRGPRGLWASMWQSPTVEFHKRLRPSQLIDRCSVKIQAVKFIQSFVHRTTHRDVHVHIYRGQFSRASGMWKSLADLDSIPISSAQLKAIRLAAGVISQ